MSEPERPGRYVLHDSAWTRLGGLRPDQLGGVAAGLGVWGVLFAAGHFFVGLAAGFAVGSAALLVRVHGVPVTALALPVVSFGVRRVRGRHRWHHDLFGVGLGWSDSLPPVFAGLEPFDHPVDGSGRVRFVWDRVAGELTLVAWLSGAGFGSTSAAGKDTLVGEWERLLAPLTESRTVARLGWQHWAPPNSPLEHQRFVDASRNGHRPAGADDYDSLIESVLPATVDRRCLLTITAAASSVGRLARVRGVRSELANDLLRLHQVLAQTSGPSLHVGDPLGVAELTAALRSRIDPARCRRDQAATLSLAAKVGTTGPRFGSMGYDERFGAGVAIDGSVHRVFWVAQWPQRPVTADWFEALTKGAPHVTQTTAVVHVPVPRGKAEAQENRRATSVDADVASKQKAGFRLKARERTATADIERREDELAAGAGLLRTAVFVMVSAGSWDELEAGCEQVLTNAAMAQVDLWPLAGRHGQGLCAALPLGRSVRVLQ